jgi:DNA primase
MMKNRLVFPVTGVNGVDIGYVGRAIDGGHLRYLSYPGTAIKRTVLWLDKLSAYNDQLWIVEGPFDALRLDWYFRCCGIFQRATCLFGTSYTPEQTAAITQVAGFYRHINILFDSDALSKAMRSQQDLRCLVTQKISVHTLPDGVSDPAELQEEQIRTLLR